ncbi:MAG: enoyl-CoA hydratase [Gammaproteobacteria bacterium]|nr:MAG: enoyl-CoA hydratase [Gammaproteobacteria bacterium]
MTDQPILTELDDRGILRLTLDTPERRNALSVAMLESLGEAIERAGADPAVRVVVIAANGPAFSAGHDLKEITAARASADRGRAFFSELMTLCSKVMQAIVNCPRPVIAEVSGIATAAGCQLVASCDLALAADDARFATPGVHIGLFCSTPMVALSRNVANKHAMEMLLTGEMVSAERAADIGLVNRAVAPEELREATLALARNIAAKSRHTIAIGKRTFHSQREKSLADAYEEASHVMVENLLARDAEEGIDAFIGKRQPVWEDR